MIKINHNVSLSSYSSMKLGGTASYQCDINDKDQLESAIKWSKNNNCDTIVVGDGNNIIWKDSGFNGLLIVNRIMGLKIVKKNSIDHLWTIGAGENWDKIVEKSVQMRLTGIESLSLIPGTAGSTVIQNVGAYGQDISQTLVSVEVYDYDSLTFKTISAKDCHLGYRTSIFKTIKPARYCVVSITLNLRLTNPSSDLYPAVKKYFTDHHIQNITPANIRQAVCDIRQQKLPNPKIIPNCGSFFINPVIKKKTFLSLQKKTTTTIPHWEINNDLVKLSAAWLIEYAGLKDFHDKNTGFATWKNQPLVIINEKSTSTSLLMEFKKKITSEVLEKTGVSLIQEPEILPSNNQLVV